MAIKMLGETITWLVVARAVAVWLVLLVCAAPSYGQTTIAAGDPSTGSVVSPAVAVSETGRIHLAWGTTMHPARCYYRYSDDSGVTFSPPLEIPQVSGAVDLAVGSGNTVYMAGSGVGPDQTWAVIVVTLVAGEAPRTAYISVPETNFYTPSIAAVGSHVYVVFRDFGGDSLLFSRSLDAGSTFEPPRRLLTSVTATSGDPFAIAAASDGTVAIAAGGSAAAAPTKPAVRLAVSTDNGATFEFREAVARETPQLPSLAIGGGGVVHVAWEASCGWAPCEEFGRWIYHATFSVDELSWTREIVVDPAPTGWGPSLTVDPYNRVRIVWSNYGDPGLSIAEEQTGSWVTSWLYAGTSGYGSFGPDTATGPDGRLWTVWNEFLTVAGGPNYIVLLARQALPPPPPPPPPASALVCLSVSVAPNGAGTVSGVPATCVEIGASVTLTATPAKGWVFAGWAGGITSDDYPLNLTLRSDLAITAQFRPRVPTILVHGYCSDPVEAFGKMGALLPVTADVDQPFDYSFFTKIGLSDSADVGVETLAVMLAGHVRRVLERTGASQVNLVAHSLGGVLAQAWMAGIVDGTLAYSGEVNRLITISSPLIGTGWSWFPKLGCSRLQRQQLEFGSGFTVRLSGLWRQFQSGPYAVDAKRILYIAGTQDISGGGNECNEQYGCDDGLVDISSAVRPEASDAQIRYLPYKHSTHKWYGLTNTPIAHVLTPQHLTLRVVASFLQSGSAPSQMELAYIPPNLDAPPDPRRDGALLVVHAFDAATGTKLRVSNLLVFGPNGCTADKTNPHYS